MQQSLLALSSKSIAHKQGMTNCRVSGWFKSNLNQALTLKNLYNFLQTCTFRCRNCAIQQDAHNDHIDSGKLGAHTQQTCRRQAVDD